MTVRWCRMTVRWHRMTVRWRRMTGFQQCLSTVPQLIEKTIQILVMEAECSCLYDIINKFPI
jgi:hypothetical protein